jgi:hypothetical protein
VPKKGQFTQERVEYNVFLFDKPLKASKSLQVFKISLTFRFDAGENSQILTVSNKKIVYTIRDQSAIFQLAILSSLAGARECIMYCSLKNQSLSSLIV